MTELALEKQVLSLLEELLQVSEHEQEEWLREKTAGNPRLRERLRALWEANKTISLRTGAAVQAVVPAPPPERIGAYRIVSEIGSGGMGTVYLAERSSGDFEHRVAIKLIKPGLLSSALIKRFERERQLLARLNHPHIARLYDGGLHGGDTPFIIMELVEGVELAEWVDDERPSLERRLDLFEQTAAAVQYAHQNLMIHRDLTPANVLVTEDDQAKLIDFGIAGVAGLAREKRPRLAANQPMMTPGYGAPEQIERGEATTLSDIYSLGKILGFLVGQFEDPELAAIATKAAHVEPEERYDSVAALVADLRNYRETRPVGAFSRSRSYTFRKLVAREKPAVFAASLAVLALLAGGSALAIGLQEARVAKAEAEMRLNETQSMANLLMFDVFDEVSRTAGTTEARLLIARNAQVFLDSVAANEGSADAQLRAGQGYYRLAQVTGGFAPGNVGELLKGIDYLERSQSLLDPLLAKAPNDERRIASARTQIALMRSKGMSYLDVPGAIRHGEKALRILESAEQDTAPIVAAEAEARRYLGDFLACCTDQAERGIGYIEEGYREVVAAAPALRQDPAVRRATNDLRNLQAGVRIFTGSDADGIPLFYEALAAQTKLAEETKEPQDFDLQAVIASNLGRTLLRMGRPEEAERVIAPIHRQAREVMAADPIDRRLQRHLATIGLAHAWIAAESGMVEKSEEYIRDGLEFARKANWALGKVALPSLTYAHHLQEASEAQWALGRIRDACATMRQALALYADYATALEVPVTSHRYRIGRMEPRLAQCPPIPPGDK